MRKLFSILLVLLIEAGIGVGLYNVMAQPEEHVLYMPMVYNGHESYDWVYIGVAVTYYPPHTTVVYGIKPGYCYDVIPEADGKTLNLRATKMDVCDTSEWYGELPPPEYAPPDTLPPPFGYGEVFKLEQAGKYDWACSDLSGCVQVMVVPPPPEE